LRVFPYIIPDWKEGGKKRKGKRGGVRVGGPAHSFFMPESEDDLLRKRKNVPLKSHVRVAQV